MDIETLAASALGRSIIRLLGAAMESRLRYRFFAPQKIVAGADILPGQTVLEVGCGTGFFTMPAARLLGEQGQLIAMDVVPESVAAVSRKVQEAALANVCVVKGDALDTALEDGSIDTVLLFGEIPAPVLPLARLLPELHRVLRPEGTLAVWPAIPVYLPEAVLRSGLFAWESRREGVYNFRRRNAS
jgi:ubiquinone/menaquinone biosynthesis C-methylase UbiE